MQKHKVIFCREGVIAEFYRAVAKKCIFPDDVSSINVAAYGTATNSLGYPIYHLHSKYSNLMRSDTDSVEVYLCYDWQSAVFNQISSDEWKDIGRKISGNFTDVKVIHIIHEHSIEDWLLADIGGLRYFFDKIPHLPKTDGREYIKSCYQENNKTYASSNEAEGKKIIAALDISKIVTAHERELASLFAP
jgi:hypothetical protein